MSWRTSSEKVLDAVEIALATLPGGGMTPFRYFCGVCNYMIQDQHIRQLWN